MSAESYRAAAVRLRTAYDLLYPYAGMCLLCGAYPDKRHRIGDAITSALLAGEDPVAVAEDYLATDATEPSPMDPVLAVYRIALATVAADPRMHGLSRKRAALIDAEVWADLTPEPTPESTP